VPATTAPETTTPSRRLTSRQAAAKMYDVDFKTVCRWVTTGLIHGYRVGGHLVKVDLNEIEAKVVKVIPAARATR
jgi:hypothetical protein